MFNEYYDYEVKPKPPRHHSLSINFIDNFLEPPKQQHDSPSLNSQVTLKKREHFFTKDDSPVLIGRTVECKVRFKEGALSRVQCTITYDEE
jgi:hypothetical protein